MLGCNRDTLACKAQRRLPRSSRARVFGNRSSARHFLSEFDVSEDAPQRESWPVPTRSCNSTDVLQLAIWLLDEHRRTSECDNCPLPDLNQRFAKRPNDLDVLRRPKVSRLLELARGELLGMLCEMQEPPEWLITATHEFVQVDDELMSALAGGADLRESHWVKDEKKQIRPDGLDEEIRICEQMLSLSDDVYEDAVRVPEGFRPKLPWSIRKQTGLIRPRAQRFLDWAMVQRRLIG